MVVCPNPRCRKEIEDPIRLTILSVTPPKQYEACPYCFAKLEQEPPIEQNQVSESQVEQDLVSKPSFEQEEPIIFEEEEKITDNISENTVLETIKGIEGQDGAPWDSITEKCEKAGIDKDSIEEALTSLMDKGLIYEPILGTIKTT